MCVEQESDKRRQVDLDDLNNEIAGRDVGREARFLGPSGGRELQAKREKADREFRSLLQQRLQDPEYRRLYDDAWSALDSAQSALDRAMLENARAKERLEGLVSEFEERAANLANGEKVFRAADGSLYTADGRKLSAAEARDVEIPPNALSYESYVQANDALEKARKRGGDLSDIQTKKIDPARAKLQDEDNPPSKDDLRKMTKELEQVTADARQSSTRSFQAAANAEPAQKAAEPPLELAELNQIPTLG